MVNALGCDPRRCGFESRSSPLMSMKMMKILAVFDVGLAVGLILGAIWGFHAHGVVHRPPQQALHRNEETQMAHGYTAASGCGIERWSVKTLTDPGANAINFTTKPTTIAALDAFKAPYSPTDRVAPVETTLWSIKAQMVAYKQEADSDIHLAVTDKGKSMIVEFPASYCDTGAVHKAQVDSARQAFIKACGQPTSYYQNLTGTATITGIGFFDRIHGQRGVAPNGIELHPAISFQGACR